MKLIVSDFDGTFFDDNYDKNIELINKYNNDFVIATGRNIESLKKDLKINCKYYICNDGGYILDDKKNILYKNYIDSNEVKIVYERLKELNYKDYFLDFIDHFDTKINDNINKVSIKIKDKNAYSDMLYILKDLKNTYGYLSDNWINILSIQSKKENAIEYLLKLEHYDKIYVIGNEINDYEMLKKYNGYLITNEDSDQYNTINSFIEIKDKISL